MSAFSAYPKSNPPKKVVYGRQLTVEDGLSSNFVYTLLQDSKNFIWIGTLNGLNKYDGHSFRHYFKKPFDSTKLQSNVIKALVEDRSGAIWVGTAGGGLSRLDRKTDKFVHFRFNANDPRSIGSDNVECLFIDSKGRLWIGLGNGGLNYFEPQSQTFWRYPMVRDMHFSLINNAVNSITEAGNGKFYIRKIRGTILFDPSTAKCEPLVLVDGGNKEIVPSNVFYEPQQGLLWIEPKRSTIYSFTSLSSTLLQREGKKIKVTTPIDFVKGKRLVRLNDTIIWNVSIFGLHEINTSSSTLVEVDIRRATNANLKLRNPRDAILTNDGFVWVATENGVVTVEPKRPPVTVYPLPETGGFLDASTRSLCLDRHGKLWAGSSDGRLFYLDSSSSTLVEYKKNMPPSLVNAINRITRDNNGGLWIVGSNRPISKINVDENTSVQWSKNIKSLSTYGHSLLVDNSSIWIGSEEQGQFNDEAALNHITFSPFSFHRYQYLPNDTGLTTRRIVTTIVNRDEHSLWIGTVHGLFIFVKKTGEFIRYAHDPKDPTSISGNDVWVIYKDSRGKIWVGTWGEGLNLFDERSKSFTHFTIENGLPSNIIYSILEDRYGDLWISTANGISRYDHSHKEFINYGITDGLLDLNYEPNSAAISSEGKLYFGGASGVVSFFPNELVRNNNPAPLTVTALRLFEKLYNGEIPTGSKVTLDYTENDFSFEFAKLDYLDPTQKAYQYKLEGVDQNWINSGQRNIAYYNNIDPGDYTFRFREKSDTSIAYASMVVITPAFWMTRVFKLGAFLAIVLLIGYLFHRRITRLKHFQAQLGLATESERIALAGELHDGPLQDLYATRFMITPFIASGALNTEATKLDTLLKKVRSDLRSMTGELQIPHFESGFAEELRLFCDAFCERHPAIQIERNITDEVHTLPIKSAQNLFRIFRTAMANVAKHANASNVEVVFSATESNATLKIVDDGIGFTVPKTFVTLSQTKHYGLLLMQNYTASINGKCSLVSALGSGTTVEVVIPIKPQFWWKKARRASL